MRFMLAKTHTPEPDDKRQPSDAASLRSPHVVKDKTELSNPTAPPRLSTAHPESALIGDGLKSKVVQFPTQQTSALPHPVDYEELLPTAEIEPTSPIRQLTSDLINRRCYYQNYWPKTAVFRIKDIDLDHNTIYLNHIYRWVKAEEILLLNNLTPSRPPTSLEVDEQDDYEYDF